MALAHGFQDFQIRVGELGLNGFGNLRRRVSQHPFLPTGNGAGHGFDDVRMFLHVTLVGKKGRIGNLAAFLADGSQNVPLALLDHLSGRGLEQGHIIAGAAGEGTRHHIELNGGVHHGVLMGNDAVLPHDVFQRHLRDAALAAAEDGGTFEIFPRKFFIGAAHQEGAVPLGQLGENLRRVLPALQMDVDAGFRPRQTNVRLARQDSGHDLVGAAAVGQLQLQAFFLEEAQFHGRVERGIEYRMGHLVDRYGGQVLFLAAAGQGAQKQHQSRHSQDNSFHTVTPIYFFSTFSSHRMHQYISAAAAARSSTVAMTRSI